MGGMGLHNFPPSTGHRPGGTISYITGPSYTLPSPETTFHRSPKSAFAPIPPVQYDSAAAPDPALGYPPAMPLNQAQQRSRSGRINPAFQIVDHGFPDIPPMQELARFSYNYARDTLSKALLARDPEKPSAEIEVICRDLYRRARTIHLRSESWRGGLDAQ